LPSEDEYQRVAVFLLGKIIDQSEYWQTDFVYDVRREFGEDFIYTNANGNEAIVKPVYKHFDRIKGPDIFWNRGSRFWCVTGDGVRKGDPKA
jgi:hypothetical protein